MSRTNSYYSEQPEECVICLISWRVSAIINAHDWLEKLVETLFDDRFCLIKYLVTLAHLFGSIHEKDSLTKTPGYQAELMHKPLCETRMLRRERLERGLHSQARTLVFLPYRVARAVKKSTKWMSYEHLEAEKRCRATL
jgi:hypothetical protein